MADIQRLIQTILSDTKFAVSGHFADKVYQDEPILITAAQMERHPPAKYRAMRNIARDRGLYRESEAKIFYEQGQFMADFEDDFKYQGEFERYFPTYQAMNDRQLRGYFSWRTKVRRGVVERTSLSFVFVYIYELINQIGVRSPEEGFHALKNFWAAYGEIDSRISRYVRLWLVDYVVYHNLDQSLLEDFSGAGFDRAVLTLLEYSSRGAEEVFSALNALSSYNMENSRFFKRRPDDVKQVVRDVFAAFSDHYDKHCKNTLCEKFFGKLFAGPYSMFNSAVFYDRIRHRDYVYEINPAYRYTCRDGQWSCERFFCYGGKNRQIGALLKTVDFLMRRKYDFKSPLKAGPTTKVLRTIIETAIEKHQASQREAARPKIEIDVSKLQSIRDAALETQNKLIVEEGGETETPEAGAEKSGPGNDAGLSDAEYQFMRRLLHGQAYDDLMRSQGLMLSVVIDAVNEKLFDRFGDTVVTETGGRPELIEDYLEELKGMIRP